MVDTRQLRRAASALIRGVGSRLRGRDVALAAAGLTFYALVAVIPLLLVALWLASLVLGDARMQSFGATLADTVGSRHGLGEALQHLVEAGVHARPAALVTSVLVAALYGEGFARALGRFRAEPATQRRALRGRLASPLLIAATAVLVAGGLVLMRYLVDAIGSGAGERALGIWLAFVICWAGASLNCAVCFRVFGPSRVTGPRFWLGTAAAGSWIAGSALGFLGVLALPLSLGTPFAGSTAIGAAVLLGFWLYLSHIAVLLGYAVSLAQPGVRSLTPP